MKTVAIENTSLPALIIELKAGGEILLTDHARPVARLVPVEQSPTALSARNLKDRREALDGLKRLGGLRDVIADPAEWQREIRQDRPLPSINGDDLR